MVFCCVTGRSSGDFMPQRREDSLNVDSSNLAKLAARDLPVAAPEEVQPEPAFAINWRRRAQQLQKQVQVFYFVLKHPRTRWYSRLVAACTVAYLLSPLQLIPSFIPVIGFLDDFLAVFFGIKLLVKITPADVLVECRERADAAEISKKEEIRSVAAVIATVWFLVAAASGAILAAYLRHQ
jgi:uncharacterized membrane protein YkvA (DUF1232 family)